MITRKLTEQVEFILATNPKSRDSDIRLTIELWKKYYDWLIDPDGKIELERLFEFPREDSIKRIRARIQNKERRYLPNDPAVFLERAKLSREWREFLGYRLHKGPELLTEKDYLNYLKEVLGPKQGKLI